MRNLLYLVHRLPYPPNKGDKVRSYHLLRHLAARHRVFLGTFVDDPDDERYIASLKPLCAGLYVARLDPRMARLRSLGGLVRGEAMSLPYYRDAGLKSWVEQTVRHQNIDTAVAFSSAMTQYLEGLPRLRVLVDCVDVDSAKWTQFAAARAWPFSWLYRREGNRLLAYESAAATRSIRSFFVTDAEVELFCRLAPECAGKVEAIGNGVDAEFFSPAHDVASPFPAGEVPIVFTGAMDYWPNIDAVRWFASDILPRLRTHTPELRFYVVGMRPAPAVRALAGEAVTVTGTVPDVRPYLRHAAVIVAPLRVARGVQNKVLEAMAMGRPVVASQACAAGIEAVPGEDFETAVDAPSFAASIDALLRNPMRAAAMGGAARECVLARYSWEARLSRIDRYLDAPTLGRASAA
ncbi:MAG: TIGR03087 family PEP-CTERM/XrtA system glycosyltransferase [Casimicrobiaceae bacterium]